MSDQHSEPRVWEMPVEPPVGTVVSDPEGKRRWRREGSSWLEIDDRGEDDGYGVGWLAVLNGECGGRVVEVRPTPAEDLAARLVSLARHLRVHRELMPVQIAKDHRGLQVDYHDRGRGCVLHEWAQTLADVSAEVGLINGNAYVRVCGKLEDLRQVHVWDRVDGLSDFLAEGELLVKGWTPLALELLAEFATSVEPTLSPEAGA